MSCLKRGGADVAVLLVDKADACGMAFIDSWRSVNINFKTRFYNIKYFFFFTTLRNLMQSTHKLLLH